MNGDLIVRPSDDDPCGPMRDPGAPLGQPISAAKATLQVLEWPDGDWAILVSCTHRGRSQEITIPRESADGVGDILRKLAEWYVPAITGRQD